MLSSQPPLQRAARRITCVVPRQLLVVTKTEDSGMLSALLQGTEQQPSGWDRQSVHSTQEAEDGGKGTRVLGERPGCPSTPLAPVSPIAQ